MSLDVYDVVRVITPIPSERVDASVSKVNGIHVGDLGTVLMVLAESPAHAVYLVECVDPDGHTRWLATLFAEEIERVPTVGAT